MSLPQNKLAIGFIPANRGFFSAELAAKMRQETIDAISRLGVDVIVPGPDDTVAFAILNQRESTGFAVSCEILEAWSAGTVEGWNDGRLE